MNIPCGLAINECLPCPENVPFANLSAEAPDFDRFFSVLSFEDTPPLGDSFSQTGCKVVCYSAVSQAEADLCALRSAQQCTWPTWRTPPSPSAPRGRPVSIFSNSEQSCVTRCPDGNPFTFTVPAGTFLSLWSQAAADDNAFQYACQQAEARKICLSGLPGGCQGDFYDEEIVATGLFVGTSNTWAITAGALPPGLFFNGGTVLGDAVRIDGVPTLSGTYSFTVAVTAPDGDSASKTFTVVIANITNSASLPDASLNSPYSVQLLTAGTTAPVTWAVEVGPLPDGVSLNTSTGLLSGTPTGAGTFNFLVSDTDANGNSCQKNFTVKVIGGCPAGGINTPCDLTTPGSGLLGTLQPPLLGGSPSIVAPAGAYTLKYISGAFHDDANPCPFFLTGDWKFVGMFAFYQSNGLQTINWADPALSYCGATVASVESQVKTCFGCTFPTGDTFAFNHDGGGASAIGISFAGAAGNPVAGPMPLWELTQVSLFPTEPTRVRIASFDPTVFANCPGEPASANPAWDGTFPNANLFPPDTFVWDSDNNKSLNGQRMIFAEVVYVNDGSLPTPTGCGWRLEVFLSTKDTWLGYKGVGTDPIGCYQRHSGCSATPMTMNIESY